MEVRNVDGTITVTDKFGTILQNKVNEKPEPNFSQFGYIMNPNPDLQIGRIETDGFCILFGETYVVPTHFVCLQPTMITTVTLFAFSKMGAITDPPEGN